MQGVLTMLGQGVLTMLWQGVLTMLGQCFKMFKYDHVMNKNPFLSYFVFYKLVNK